MAASSSRHLTTAHTLCQACYHPCSNLVSDRGPGLELPGVAVSAAGESRVPHRVADATVEAKLMYSIETYVNE